MSSSLKIYWDHRANEFDTFYRREKKVLRKLVDRIFRKGMKERFLLTLKECNDVSGKKILDVGCGPGRIAVELAKQGAYVIGIDFSQNMVNLANNLAEKLGLNEKCKFVCDDFLRHAFKKKFNMVIALGLFDYTPNPAPYLAKIKSLTTEKCIMSFPCKFSMQTPLRIAWLRRRKCPVFFYTKRKVRNLLSQYFSDFRVSSISADYFCVANLHLNKKGKVA